MNILEEKVQLWPSYTTNRLSNFICLLPNCRGSNLILYVYSCFSVSETDTGQLQHPKVQLNYNY